MSAAIAQKGAELWLSRRVFQRLTARACYESSPSMASDRLDKVDM